MRATWILAGHDSILAVDIGGSNIRAGIVEFNTKKNRDLSAASVHRLELWRHCDDAPKREDAVGRLIEFVLDLVKRAAKDGLTLAPFIGIGCPGVIRATVRSSAAARTCQATGRPKVSICRSDCARRYPQSTITTQ